MKIRISTLFSNMIGGFKAFSDISPEAMRKVVFAGRD